MSGILDDIYKVNPATGAYTKSQYTQPIKKPGATTTTVNTVAPAVYPTYTPNTAGLQSQFANIMAGYEQQQQALRNQYQTNLGQADTAYQNLLSSLGKQEQASKEQFGASRATIAEDAFTRGRNVANALASRMLSGSGLMQLGDVQNRMETGRQVSQAAGQFGETQENIAQAKTEGTQSYEAAKRQLADSLASNLANIMTQQGTTGLSYQQQMEAMRQAAASSQQGAFAYNEQQKAAQNALGLNASLISGMNPGEEGSYDYNTRIQAIAQLNNEAGTPTSEVAIRNQINNDAIAKYKAAIGTDKYENSTAKALKLAYIAAGYPASLFNIETPKTTQAAVTPPNWVAPTTAGTTYGQLVQVGGRNFMWDGNKWVPKA